MGALALTLGILIVAGVVQLWHVYIFAFLFGSAAAFDAPVRQTFVAELVGDDDLHNAVALNSTSSNAARMIGPAVSGVVIAAIGTGWGFLINGASFVVVPISLSLFRVDVSLYTLLQVLSVTILEKMPMQSAFLAEASEPEDAMDANQLDLFVFPPGTRPCGQTGAQPSGD